MKTALQILNEVEPYGELLCTEQALQAMENYNQQFPGFWERLKLFVENVQVNDPMSEEEKEMIINVCDKNLKV